MLFMIDPGSRLSLYLMEMQHFGVILSKQRTKFPISLPVKLQKQVRCSKLIYRGYYLLLIVLLCDMVSQNQAKSV